jgi:hypothetical protein
MDGSLPPLPPLTPQESQEFVRRRRGRNWAVLLALLATSLLFYGIFMAKMVHH